MVVSTTTGFLFEYRNWTDADREGSSAELQTELPSLWEQYIERLSEYMKSSEKEYMPPQSGAGRTLTKGKRNRDNSVEENL